MEDLSTTLRGMRVCSHLYFIVLKENVGFEVVNGLVDYVCVDAYRKQKYVKKEGSDEEPDLHDVT